MQEIYIPLLFRHEGRVQGGAVRHRSRGGGRRRHGVLPAKGEPGACRQVEEGRG